MIAIFISGTTKDFGKVREEIRNRIDHFDVLFIMQEILTETGTDTLDKLDQHIKECAAVVHLVGNNGGWVPKPARIANWLKNSPDFSARMGVDGFDAGSVQTCTATQWEAWLAINHGKPLYVFQPMAATALDASQQAHLQSLTALKKPPRKHHDTKDQVQQRLQRLLLSAGQKKKPFNLPRATLGRLFKGRATEMEQLRAALTNKASAAIVEAGLGGVGKTRLALEYGPAHADDYTALLFVEADSPEKLRSQMAALTGPMVLNLEAQHAKEDKDKIAAALNWLREHAGWYLILDNVDTPDAQKAATEMLTHLAMGHLVSTSRIRRWHSGVQRLDLDVLMPDAARDLLLEAAQDRRKLADDSAQAALVAERLGHFALVLEQAAA